MARSDYNDWLNSNLGSSDEDLDTSAKAIGNIKDLHDTTLGRFIKGYKKGKSTKSVIGMASRNTFEFPVFCSKSVPLDYATATNQLLEQLYAAYVQMAISQNPIVDSKSLKHGGFLSNFQTNTTKYVEYTDMSYAHEACHNVIVTESYEFEFNMLNCSDADAQEILECMDYEPLSEFDHFFQEAGGIRRTKREEDEYEINNNSRDGAGQTEKSTTIDNVTTRVPGATTRRDNATKAQLTKRQLEKTTSDLSDNDELGDSDYGRDVINRRRKAQYDADKAEWDLDPDDIGRFGPNAKDANGNELSNSAQRETHNRRRKTKAEADKAGYDAEIKKRDLATYGRKEKDRQEEHKQKMMTRAPEVLKEEDMRKVNSMKPLLMKLQMRIKNANGNVADNPVEFIVGVHTHCRLIEPSSLPDMVKFPLKEMNAITRHVKWKAGELRFMRDLVFQIKEKKQTAIDSRDPNRKWYRRLYELAHEKGDANVAYDLSGNKTTGLIPNATILMTNGDVENIKASTKLDVLKPSLAKKLCSELFLMALVVIDQDAESIKLFIPDNYADWEVHSLASVEKQLAELSTAGSKTRDLFKMLK